MRRILQYIGSLDRGGAQSAVMNLYGEIDRAEWQFDFVTHDEGIGEFEPKVKALGARVYHLPSFEKIGPTRFADMWKTFLSEHSEWHVLHSHMRSTAALVVPIAKRAGMATIVHSHSTHNDGGAKMIVKALLQYPIRFQADFLVGCSSEAGRWLFGKRAFKSNRYVYLPNAIDLDRYCFDEEKRAAMRAELGIGDRLVFGHVGRLHESKNHDFLIEVFSGLRERFPSSVLLLVGDGPLRAHIEELIEEGGLGGSVLMLGDRPDVPNLLQAMDAFLFPSRWEGLPVSVVEALACGLPCYISDTITHDVDICEDVRRLSIGDASAWVGSVVPKGRIDGRKAIKAAGFDIHDSARTLLGLYERAERLAEGRRRR